jgi:hypothetical protein
MPDPLETLQDTIYGTYPTPIYPVGSLEEAHGAVTIVPPQQDEPAAFDARGQPA